MKAFLAAALTATIGANVSSVATAYDGCGYYPGPSYYSAPSGVAIAAPGYGFAGGGYAPSYYPPPAVYQAPVYSPVYPSYGYLHLHGHGHAYYGGHYSGHGYYSGHHHHH